MKYKLEYMNNADLLVKDNEVISEILEKLMNFNEKKLIEIYLQDKFVSLANAFKKQLNDELLQNNWTSSKYIYNDTQFMTKRWSNHFCKKNAILNTAFDHNISACWNIVKGELDCRESRIKKNDYSDFQIIITATKRFASIGGFDSAIGTFEDYVTYFKPMSAILKYPVLLIGLNDLECFKIQKIRSNNRTIGKVIEVKD